MADDASVPERALPPHLRGAYAPVADELDSGPLTIRGELPAGLNGSLFRNGPNPQFPDPASHWFLGDGMIHAFDLAEGTARYRNRWVRTPRWLTERKAGRQVYAGFGMRRPDAPDWAGDGSGVANTNVVAHAGRLLALEEAHLPMEMAADSLDTRGYADFGGLQGPFTAHPKTDPRTGELLFFGYSAAGPFSPEVSVGALSAEGKVERFERIAAPYASMIHDFAATDRFMVLPVLPLTGSLDRARRGQPPYAWEPEAGAYLGLIRRGGPAAEVRWFEGAPAYAFHVMNAWEEGGRVVIELVAYDQAPLFPRADGGPADPAWQVGRLARWSLDPDGPARFEQTWIDDLRSEFPRIDERWTGRKHRHGWYAAVNPKGPSRELNGLVHVDNRTGVRTAWWLGPHDVVSEPVFAPRGEDEGDGWILAIAWRGEEARSELLVFEARDIGAGPVAGVEAPRRVPFGFHGSWVPQGAAS